MALGPSGYPTSGRSVRFAVLAIFFAVVLLVFRSTAPDRAYASQGSGMGAISDLSAGCPTASSGEIGAGDFPMPPAGKLHVLVSQSCVAFVGS